MSCRLSDKDLVVQFATNAVNVVNDDNTLIPNSCNLGLNISNNFINKCPSNGEYIETANVNDTCFTTMNPYFSAQVTGGGSEGAGFSIPPLDLSIEYNPRYSLNTNLSLDHSRTGYSVGCASSSNKPTFNITPNASFPTSTSLNSHYTAPSLNGDPDINASFEACLPGIGCHSVNWNDLPDVAQNVFTSYAIAGCASYAEANSIFSDSGTVNTTIDFNKSVDIDTLHTSFNASGSVTCNFTPARVGADFNLSMQPTAGVEAQATFPLPGYKTRCVRTGYNAPPAFSCIKEVVNDPKYNNNTPLNPVFQLQNGNYVTGDPKYQPNLPTCDNYVNQVCSTDGVYQGLTEYDNTNYKQFAQGGICYNYVTENGSNTGQATVLYNAIQNMAAKYPLTSYESWTPEVTNTWYGLLQAAQKSQGIGYASRAIDNICSAVPRYQVSACYDTVTSSPPGAVTKEAVVYGFCACHMNASQYSYYNGILDLGTYHECDPLCLSGTSQNIAVPSYANNNKVTCSQSNCIIDDITVNIIDSNVGNIVIDQVCGSNQPSSCYFTNQDTFNAAKTVTADACQKCYIYSGPSGSPQSQVQQVDCTTGAPIGGLVKTVLTKRKIKSKNYGWWIILFLILIFVILFLIYKS